MKNIVAALLLLGVATTAFGVPTVPEIDASTATGAITLISGAALLLGSRRSR